MLDPAASAESGLHNGFADPIHDAQRTFRALMQAFARPGQAVPVAADLPAPPPLTPVLAALLLTLCDFETTLWLAPDLATEAVQRYLRFHTGTRLVTDPAAAAFVVLADPGDLDDLGRFAQGTAEYPDRSATLLVLAQTRQQQHLRLRGPGIENTVMAALPALPAAFPAAWQANGKRYPCGVDIVLLTAAGVIGLPRTTRIEFGEA